MSEGEELEEVERKKRNRQAIYKIEATAINQAAISDLVTEAAEGMARIASAEKVPLDNVKEVQIATGLYMQSCADKSMMPTMSGLAGALGYTRQALYIYIKRHGNTETAAWLQECSDRFGEIVMQAALSGNVSAIPAIFTVKARYGWREDQDLPLIEAGEKELTTEEIMERYKDLPD